MSLAYLRLAVFVPEFLIPVCASSSPAFCMMYSAYKLNKQGDNTQPWHTPFSIWNQSIVLCAVLTVASWAVYRFLRKKKGTLVFPCLEEFSNTIPKKGNNKECLAFQSQRNAMSKGHSNYCTIALFSHASTVMLKILQARLQQFMNRELPDVQPGF